jgi:hypothetical protein
MFRFQFMEPYFPGNEPVRVMEAKKAIDPDALKRWNDIWRDVEVKTTDALQKTVKAIEADALLKGAAQLATQMQFAKKTTFSLSNPRAVAFMRKTGGRLSYIKDIQDTTKESLKGLMTTALDEGWSYSQTGKEIRKLFDGPITTKRAQLIATTEAGNAYEAGNRAFADTLVDDGVEMEKSWVVSQSNVCDVCLANEAEKWIPIDQAHSSGDQEPLAHPGCRCYEQYRQVRA